ncbi:hypothetical protein KCV07_g5859, partial [Aureobasidium melanogenum]
MADTSYKRLLTVNETKSGRELVSSSLELLGLSHATSYELDDLSVRTPDTKPKWTAKPRAISTTLAQRLATWTQQILRSFRLLLLMAIGPWKKKEEQPKIALYAGWVSVSTGLLVHLMPLAACIVLIYLNVTSKFASAYISPFAPYQFIAKILELLAQASLGSAVFVYLRALYTGPEVVPFGALFAGLQITKVSYLWSLEFAGVVTSTNFGRTVGIGPSINIALTPRLGDLYGGWAEAWINATEVQIFPLNIDPAVQVYNFLNNCSTGDCARYGWDTAMTVAQVTSQSRDATDGEELYGSYMLTQDATPNRELRWNVSAEASLLSTTATIPSKVIAWSLSRLALQSYHDSKMFSTAVQNFTTRSRQPTVTVNCTNAVWLNPTSVRASFTDDQYKPHDYVLQSESLRRMNDTGSLNWAFIDLDHPVAQGPSQSDPSVWVFIRFTQDAYPAALGPFGLCAIYAGYAYVQNMVSINTDAYTINNQLVSSRTNGLPASTINITATWLNHTLPDLNTLLSYGLAEVDAPTFLATSLAISVAQWPKQILSYPKNAPHSLGTSLYLDDSNLGIIVGSNSSAWYTKSLQWLGSSYQDHIFFPGSEYAEVLGKYRLQIDVSSHGYGYWIDHPTKVVAISVLAAYCLYIMIFMILALTLHRTHSNAWDSIGELTALAIMSRPDDKLRNTSAGIETVALFRLPMNIRANDNNHLEILFGDNEGGPQAGVVEKDKEYE